MSRFAYLMAGISTTCMVWSGVEVARNYGWPGYAIAVAGLLMCTVLGALAEHAKREVAS